MNDIEAGAFANNSHPALRPETIRLVSWNINRGLRLDQVVEFLRYANADLILLQEADINAIRTDRRNTARHIAQALRMNYIFAREFQELGQGSSNSPAYHGQVTFSRFPLQRARVVTFSRQSNFWQPLPFLPPFAFLQRRLGGRIALCCEVLIGDCSIIAYNAHLESRGNDELRGSQLSELIADSRRHDAPVLIAADFNFDLRCGSAAACIESRQLENPFAARGHRPTAARPRRGRDSSIDWILTSRAFTVSEPQVHSDVSASDHFPLSLQLRWA